MTMAQFCARVRKRGDLPPVSMKEVYAHPTIRSLAEALLDSNVARAAELLEGLERESTSRTPLERALLLGLRARIVALGEGSAAALALLAERRLELDAPEARAALDRAAASLLESEGRFDAAADAYEGRYGGPRRDE